MISSNSIDSIGVPMRITTINFKVVTSENTRLIWFVSSFTLLITFSLLIKIVLLLTFLRPVIWYSGYTCNEMELIGGHGRIWLDLVSKRTKITKPKRHFWNPSWIKKSKRKEYNASFLKTSTPLNITKIFFKNSYENHSRSSWEN